MDAVHTRSIPLLDLKAQFEPIRDEVMAEIRKVCDSQYFILGASVERFEKEIAAYCETRHAIGCASGSDALLLSLMALGIGAGDEVITTPFTFFATAGAIWHTGARPVFVDIEESTFNIDPLKLETALAAHPKTRAIIPVHLYGGCADMDPILAAASPRQIPVIEDAAQSIGARYQDRLAGGMGLTGCFSFFPSKNLGAFGDGGMITTNDDALAARLRSLRVHGSSEKYIYDYVGLNSRLDALQAAILSVKLRSLDSWTEGRRRNAALYTRLFTEAGIPMVTPALPPYQTRHIYNQYVIRCENRDALQKFLREHGVGTEIYYPVPLHLQKCFSSLGYKQGDFPVSERAAAEVLALPIHSELATADIESVVELIGQYYHG